MTSYTGPGKSNLLLFLLSYFSYLVVFEIFTKRKIQCYCYQNKIFPYSYFGMEFLLFIVEVLMFLL